MSALHFCPDCGEKTLEWRSRKDLRCQKCGFRYFHNTAGAVGGILRCGNEVLLTIRGREPAKGMLDLPGGFVDPDENLEEALSREIKEELGIELSGFNYLSSGSNVYRYADVEYNTVDVFFEKRLDSKPLVDAQDDVADTRWLALQDIPPDEIAFDSIRALLQELLQGLSAE